MYNKKNVQKQNLVKCVIIKDKNGLSMPGESLRIMNIIYEYIIIIAI